jgi:chemotaxis protein MotB
MARGGDNNKRPVIVIKKKGGGHAHHGGAWKVAYADFVTAMMALFMVLWLVSQTDESTRSVLAHYFRSGVFSGSGHVIGDSVPTGHGPTQGGGVRWGEPGAGGYASEQRELESAATQVQSALDLAVLDAPELEPLREQIEVTVTDDGLLIQISDGSDDLLFGLASAELTPSLRTFLETLGPALGRLANQLQIHGHTDGRPFPAGSEFDNWDLSFRRGDEAREYLEAHGVRHGQIVAVVGHADSDLRYPEEPLDPRNRRLTILAVRRGFERPSAHGAPRPEAVPAAGAPGDAGHEGEPEGAHAQAETTDGAGREVVAEAPDRGGEP